MSTAAKLFALAFVVGGLAFGTRMTLAKGPAPCPFEPPTLLGTCVSHQDCQEKCDLYNDPGSTCGACSGGGCCACLE